MLRVLVLVFSLRIVAVLTLIRCIGRISPVDEDGGVVRLFSAVELFGCLTVVSDVKLPNGRHSDRFLNTFPVEWV